MSDHLRTDAEVPPDTPEMSAVKLVSFSQRDRELLRMFLGRPSRAGVNLKVIDEHSDEPFELLIANAVATPEAREVLRAWSGARPAIGIVERFETDAKHYQIVQDGQMLFSLAQAINRIRAGWTPPIPVRADVDSGAPHDAPQGLVAAPVKVNAHANAAAVLPPPAVLSTGVATAPTVAATAATTVSAGLPWQRALNILVIDDSHFSREAISVALVKVGFAVTTAEDGKTGLRIASEKLFDVALVDFEMPGMQGPEVLRKLRALGAKAPTLLIMLTSRTGAVDRLRAKFAGCDAYMTKPTKMQEFLKILRDFAVAGKLSRS